MKTLFSIVEGRHFFCTPISLFIDKSICISNTNTYNNSPNLFNTLNSSLFSKMNKNIIQMNMGMMSQKECNAVTSVSKSKYIKTIKKNKMYVIGNTTNELKISSDIFLVYQGHHGDKNAKNASCILPSSAFSEKTAHYINNDGYVYKTKAAVLSPGVSKDDCEILLAFAKMNNLPIKFKNKDDIVLYLDNTLNTRMSNAFSKTISTNTSSSQVSSVIFKPAHYNFYKMDTISINSRNLQSAISMNSARMSSNNFFDLKV
jgi:NADH dehydrogenase/NADH:ubiquinone oxidoreductase subunit G